MDSRGPFKNSSEKMEFQVGADVKLRFGGRKFYDIRIPAYDELANIDTNGDGGSAKLFRYVEDNCIGKDLMFTGPFATLPGKMTGLNDY